MQRRVIWYVQRNVSPPLSRQNMQVYSVEIPSIYHTTRVRPKALHSHSHVNFKSYQIRHRPLKIKHASLLNKRIWGLILHHDIRELPVRKIRFVYYKFRRVREPQFSYTDVHAAALLKFLLIMQTSSYSVQDEPTITSEMSPMEHQLRLVLSRHVFSACSLAA